MRRSGVITKTQRKSTLGRAQNRNRFALVAAVHPKVCPVDGNHGMLGEEFAHPDEAQIGEVGLPIGITVSEPGELVEMIAAVKRQRDQPVVQHRKCDRSVLEVKRGFRQYRLAGQKRLRDVGCDLHRPSMVFIVSVGERDQKSRIGNSLHERENPLRVDKSRAPRTVPASRMKD